MRRAIPLILCLLLPATVLAAGKLYKWTDAEGVTHYTDEPPPDQQAFETRPVRADAPAAPVAEIAPAEESENCRLVRQNVATLEGGGEVRMDLDGDGEPESLTDPQKAAQLAIARQQVGVYCSTTPPGEGAGEAGEDDEG